MCYQFTAHSTMNVGKYRYGLLHVPVNNTSLFARFIFQPSLQINIAQYTVCLSTLQLSTFFHWVDQKFIPVNVYFFHLFFYPVSFLNSVSKFFSHNHDQLFMCGNVLQASYWKQVSIIMYLAVVYVFQSILEHQNFNDVSF